MDGRLGWQGLLRTIHTKRLDRLKSQASLDFSTRGGETVKSVIATAAQIPSNERSVRAWVAPTLSLLALLLVLYAPVLRALVAQWWTDPNYSHGFLVPVFSFFVLWKDRQRLRALSFRPNNWGLPVMIAGISLLIAGTLGAELFISRVSLLVLLSGLIIFLAGKQVLRELSFPLGFLFFMIPLPGLIYYEITLPLQLLASRLAAVCLDMLRVPVLREGNLLVLPRFTLDVAEACSGIRSLFSLLTLAMAYSYINARHLWRHFALLVLMLPIAIISNAFRIVGAALATYLWGPQWADGFFHLFSGWFIFIIAFTLMLLCHKLLQRTGAKERRPC